MIVEDIQELVLIECSFDWSLEEGKDERRIQNVFFCFFGR